MNFLSSNIAIDLQFTKEAFQQLPEVTNTCYQSGIEKYRSLIGYKKQFENEIRLIVHHVYDFEFYYSAGKYSIDYVDLLQISIATRSFSRVFEKFRGMELLGEIHTHPAYASEIGKSSFLPSEHDIACIAKEYNQGVLLFTQPYVFGIGGLLDSGETGYNFYHLKQNNSDTSFVKVNWLPDK